MIRHHTDVSTRKVGGAAVAIALVLILSALAPFAVALEIHHVLAAADHDGHQHSDFDLCQWVQHHTGNSLQITVPVIERFLGTALHRFSAPATLLSASLISSTPSRAPPLS